MIKNKNNQNQSVTVEKILQMGFSNEKNLRIYIQESYESSPEWKKVKGIINKFAEFLSDPKVEKQIT